jgi:hypothetical protein
MASVHKEIRRPEHDPPATGGHLVLITGHGDDQVSFRNPSGHTPQAGRATLPMSTFDRFTAHRGISLHIQRGCRNYTALDAWRALQRSRRARTWCRTRASGVGDTPMQRVRWSTALALSSAPQHRNDPPGPGSGRRRRRGDYVTAGHRGVSDAHRADALVIWDYHQMHHPLRPCSAGIGLGSHDLGVATLAADLYHAGLFPVLVFTGANSPTTAARFPRGESSPLRRARDHARRPPVRHHH